MEFNDNWGGILNVLEKVDTFNPNYSASSTATVEKIPCVYVTPREFRLGKMDAAYRIIAAEVHSISSDGNRHTEKHQEENKTAGEIECVTTSDLVLDLTGEDALAFDPTPGQRSCFHFLVRAAGKQPGIYSATITVMGNGLPSSIEQEIPVYLEIPYNHHFQVHAQVLPPSNRAPTGRDGMIECCNYSDVPGMASLSLKDNLEELTRIDFLLQAREVVTCTFEARTAPDSKAGSPEWEVNLANWTTRAVTRVSGPRRLQANQSPSRGDNPSPNRRLTQLTLRRH